MNKPEQAVAEYFREQRTMFSIKYSQCQNTVRIIAGAPYGPTSVFEKNIKFKTEDDATLFHLIVNTINAAIRKDYNGKFAMSFVWDTVDITSETPIPITQQNDIRQRIQKVLDLNILPFLKKI